MTDFRVEAAYAVTLSDEQLADVAAAVGGVVHYDSDSHVVTVATTVQADDGRAAHAAAADWIARLLDVPHLAGAAGPVRLTVEREDVRLWRTPIVGTAEVATLLGVSAQRVRQLAQEPGFPRPVAELAAGHIYRTADVAAYAAQRNRAPGRPRAAA